MLEKILQKLKLQRGTTSNVSDRSLEDLAKSLVPIITTDAILEVTDLTGAITSLDGNISHYTAESLKKIKMEEEASKLKLIAEEKTRKEEEERLKALAEDKETPEWVKAMQEQMRVQEEANKVMLNSINTLKTDKLTSDRSVKIQALLKGLPDIVSSTMQESFKTTSFKDEAGFDEYLAIMKTKKESFLQKAKEDGITIITPKDDIKKVDLGGETKELNGALALVEKERVKNLKNE